jgi:O-antigen/teichoic acid export membrane protein
MSLLNDIRSGVKDSIIYSFGNLSTKLVGFILIPLYTKYLSVEDYAILALLEISAQFIVAVFGFRISSALLRLYWDKEYAGKQKVMFFTSLSFLTGISLISMIVFIYLSDTISVLLFDNPEFSYPLILMFISTGMQIIALQCLTQIRINEKPLLFSISNFLRLITTLSFTVYFIAYQNKNIEAIYEAQLIGYIIFFLTIFRFIIRHIEFKIDHQMLYAMLAYSSPLILAEVASVIFTITSRYCLNFLSTLHEVGIFSLGFKMANTLKVFIVSSVMLAISPMIFKKIDDQDSKRFYSKIMTYFSFGLMFFVMAISIFGKEIIHFLAKNKSYWDAYQVIPILSLAIFFAMLKDVSLTGLHITKRTKVISAIISSMAILNIGLNAVFIILWQSIGAALATLMSQILFFISIYYAAQKYYPIPYEVIKIIKIIIVGLVLFGLSLYADNFDIIIRLVIKSTILLIYPVILYYWKFYEEIELIRLKQSWHKWKKIKNWSQIFNKHD